MPITLLRRERRFYELFDEQAATVVAASIALRAAFDDIEGMAAHQVNIKDLEHAGDDLTHEIVRLLNRTFITPF